MMSRAACHLCWEQIGTRDVTNYIRKHDTYMRAHSVDFHDV